MRIFVDVDGTLTDTQCARSFYRKKLRLDVIAKVKELADAGHEIIVWSGSTAYAHDVAEILKTDHGVRHIVAAIGKPQLCVDNEDRKWGRRIKKSMVTPEKFLEMTVSPA